MSRHTAKIAFLHPRPGLGRAAFERHWRTVHGPLVATSPGYGAWRLRYVQNHVLGPGPVGEGFDGFGMATFVLPGDGSNEEEYSASAIYRERVAVDERSFIDMGRTVSMTARVSTLRSGTGAAKVVVLSVVTGSPSPTDRDAASLASAEAFLVSPLGSRVHGLCVSVVQPGSFRLPGARAAPAQRVDCIHEVWIDEPRPGDPAWQNLLPSGVLGEPRSFQAEELVFFDAEPTGLALAGGAPDDTP